jgi:hypothetical protein
MRSALLFYLFVIPLVSGDISMSVNFKTSVNDISDKFVSTEIDFSRLMQSQGNFSVLTPSYLKIKNFLAYLRQPDSHVRAPEMLAVFQSLQ